MLLQELAQQALGGFAIPAALDQNIQDKAILIDRPPQLVLPAGDTDDNLIEVPPINRSRSAAADAVGELPTELLGPAANCFVANLNPAGGQHLLHHSKAQGEAEVQPDREADHLGGEAVAGVQCRTGLLHIPHTPTPNPISLM
jgi:hypothetical protein